MMSSTPPSPSSEEKDISLTLASARNLVELLLLRGQTPNQIASKVKVDGRWREVTWAEQLHRIRCVGEGLKAIGIQPGDRVAIFAATRFEWFLANMGVYAAGATVVPIYGSNTPSEIEHILRDSQARAIFIDHDQGDARQCGRLTRVLQVRDHLPDLKDIFLFDAPAGGEWMSLADLEQKGLPGVEANPRLLETRAAETRPDDVAYLLYTSGTTGLPKGVMLTHANWTSQARSVATIGLLSDNEVALLFLPLAHAFALIVFAAHLGKGIGVAYAESIDKAIDNARETNATLITLVPRVLEKAYNKVIADGSAQPGIKGQIFLWGLGQFEEYAAARTAGKEYTSVQWTLAQKLVFSQIQNKLRARFGSGMSKFISGGAPLSKKIAYFFDLCGFHLCEGYGLTETCAPTHVNLPIEGKKKLGSVGLPWPGVETRIAEDGELLLRGPQIMKGYFGKPSETAAAIDADGWFHTGDIGQVDAEGFLSITDRKKDLLKTSGGKYIAPQELENGLKSEPLIGSVLIIGDRRKFVSALFSLAPDTLLDFAEEKKLASRDYAELVRRPEVRTRIEAAVAKLNATLPSYATIKKFQIVDEEWSQKNGLITPTLKVKRAVALDRYREIVDAMYEGERFD